jgi:hypothetical protein
MTTINWTGGTGNWAQIIKWDLQRLPAPGDDVVLGGTTTYTSFIGTTNVFDPNSFSVDSVTISDPGATLGIRGGASLDITGTATTALDSSGTITLGDTSGGGTIKDAGGLLGTVVGFGQYHGGGRIWRHVRGQRWDAQYQRRAVDGGGVAGR